MINNSFLYQYTEGDLRGCELVRQPLLYILGHWLNGEGGISVLSTLYVCSLDF